MSKPNNGGPAFATSRVACPTGGCDQEGMSLRAWLAGQANEAFAIYRYIHKGDKRWGIEEMIAEVAGIRLRLADAMIAELEKETEDETDDDLCPRPGRVCGVCDKLEECRAAVAAADADADAIIRPRRRFEPPAVYAKPESAAGSTDQEKDSG